MAQRYGTLTLDDILTHRFPTVLDIGEQNLYEIFNNDLRFHRQLLNENMQEFVEITQDRQRGWGGTASIDMDVMDEMGTPDAQKMELPRITLGFPLRRYGIALQWTRHWFLRHTPQEMAIQLQSEEDADVRRVRTELMRSVFVPTNYSFVDRLGPQGITLAVKRLLNADGTIIPQGPNGLTFDGATHTHYLATAALAAADIRALINTVIEHYSAGEVLLYINQADEVTVRAMSATGFQPYVDARIVQPLTATYARGRTVDYFNVNNRAIGIFDSAEVWVKPWIPVGYMYCYVNGTQKPLVMRVPDVGEQGLHLEFDDEVHPLRAQVVAHEYGFGVFNRMAGAVLYTGGGAYVAPTL